MTTLTALIALRTPRESAGATFGVVSAINSFAFSGAPFLAGIAAAQLGLRAVFPLCALFSLGMLLLCLRADPRDVPAPAPAPHRTPQPRKSTSA